MKQEEKFHEISPDFSQFFIPYINFKIILKNNLALIASTFFRLDFVKTYTPTFRSICDHFNRYDLTLIKLFESLNMAFN